MSFAACKIHESAIKKWKHVFFCMHSHNGETEEMVSECGGGKVIVSWLFTFSRMCWRGGKNTETRHTPDISVQLTPVPLKINSTWWWIWSQGFKHWLTMWHNLIKWTKPPAVGGRHLGNLHFGFVVLPGFVKRLFEILLEEKAES